jgi:hypothetical protein
MRFTEYFNLEKNQLQVDFVNIDLDEDTALFVDPWLIRINKSALGHHCQYLLQSFFGELIRIIQAGDKESALSLLNYLHEPQETRLGYSSGGISGSAIGADHAVQIYDAFFQSRAVKTGLLKDIEDVALMIDGIGVDKISDLITNIIRKTLIDYTKQQCELLGIPIESVSSGYYWNSEERGWDRSSVELPIYKGSKVILVPKAFVSRNLYIRADDFYNKGILEFEQNRHLDARTELCRVLKNGDVRPPSKKVLKGEIPYSKDLIYAFIKEHLDVLDSYKREKERTASVHQKERLTDDQIIAVSEEVASASDTANSIIELFRNIPTGTKDADNYHNLIIGALGFIFSEDLQEPVKEFPKNEGRKRVDISMFNNSTSGFFLNCVKVGVVCGRIFFECKNYKDDPDNPAIDQLIGRFDVRQTKIGFLVCRKIEDKQLFLERCKDAVKQNGNYVIGLDDNDIIKLLRMRADKNKRGVDDFLQKKLDEITNY